MATQPELFDTPKADGAELMPAGRMLAAGVDEAGRGPLAGPVYAAAVILDPDRPIAGLDDSKKLSAGRREFLADRIRERALAWAVASASVEEIERLNILQATMLAMRRACLELSLAPALVLVDGNRLPKGLPCRARAVVGGDALEPAISAASILAKTARDACCLELHARYPQYAFDRHKGYGTALHLARLAEFGPCPEHRRGFAPVRRLLDAGDPAALSPPDHSKVKSAPLGGSEPKAQRGGSFSPQGRPKVKSAPLGGSEPKAQRGGFS